MNKLCAWNFIVIVTAPFLLTAHTRTHTQMQVTDEPKMYSFIRQHANDQYLCFWLEMCELEDAWVCVCVCVREGGRQTAMDWVFIHAWELVCECVSEAHKTKRSGPLGPVVRNCAGGILAIPAARGSIFPQVTDSDIIKPLLTRQTISTPSRPSIDNRAFQTYETGQNLPSI